MAASRETAIGVATSLLGVAAMAVDHLLGDDPGLEDPGAFAVSSGLVVVVAVALFALVVPRAAPGAATGRALALAVLATASLAIAFLGLPFPLAGAAVALGLRGRGEGSRIATAALVVGAAVLGLVTAGYAVQAVSKLTS